MTPTMGMISCPIARPREYQGTALRRVCTNDPKGTAIRNVASGASAASTPISRFVAPRRTSNTAMNAAAASNAPK